MKIAFIGLLFVAVSLGCEIHRHLEKISQAQEENTNSCNQQNFDIHYLCGLLVATNFRKFDFDLLSELKILFISYFILRWAYA